MFQRFYDATQPPGQGELSELISTHISTCLSRFASQRIDFISVISTSFANSFTVFCYRFQLTIISWNALNNSHRLVPNVWCSGNVSHLIWAWMEKKGSYIFRNAKTLKNTFRFKSMLIVAKAPRLRINFNNDVSFLDSAFLAAYSESITHADLSIYGENVRWSKHVML